MSRILCVHHVNVECKDLERMKAWYRLVFDLEDLDRGPGIGIVPNQLFLGESELHFSVMEEPTYPRRAHMALEVKEWDAMMTRLKELAIELAQDAPPGYRPDGSSAAFIRDPEGNLVELTYHPAGRRWV